MYSRRFAIGFIFSIFNINLGPDLQLCNGLADTILATGEFVDIDWYQNGVLLIDDDSLLVVNQTGMYEVVVIDSPRLLSS
jgi:hypothetical protein